MKSFSLRGDKQWRSLSCLPRLLRNESSQGKLRHCLTAFLGVALAASLLAMPAQAWAKYTDVSSQYPASQDLTEVAREGLSAIGKSIYPYAVEAGSIVDGTYIVPAYTSSRMCNFYASQADATAKSNPNQVVLNVSGGVVTATFYMSGAYNALYFGTAEQAAALAPEDGLTPSPSYFVDGNDSYDTGHGPFTVQLASLNTSFSFAVYNGGTKGIEGGVWYNRLGSVIITTDFAETNVIGASPEPDPEPEPDPGSNGNQNGSTTDDPGSENDANQNAGQAASGEEQQQENERQEDQAGEDDADQSSGSGSTLRGKRLTIVKANDGEDGGSQTVLDGELLSLEGLTPAQVALILGICSALAGAIAFIVRFFLQLRSGFSSKGAPPPA